MLFLRSLINFFFVPVISLVLVKYLSKGKEDANSAYDIKPTFGLLLKYTVLATLNIPLTRVFTYFGRITTGIDIEADSSYYTICAILASTMMAYFLHIIEKKR